MPSVETLYQLVRHLDCSIDFVIGNEGHSVHQEQDSYPQKDFIFQSLEETPSINMENGVRWEKLAVHPETDIEALRVTYQPGGSSSVEGSYMTHLGIEHITITSGVLTLLFQFEEHVLQAGDSLAFDSQRPHLFVNREELPAVGVWYMVGRKVHLDQSNPPIAGMKSQQKGQLKTATDVLRAFRDE